MIEICKSNFDFHITVQVPTTVFFVDKPQSINQSMLLQLEERLSGIQKEKNDLQSKMEEDEEDLLDMTKKYNAAVKQVGVVNSSHGKQLYHPKGNVNIPS